MYKKIGGFVEPPIFAFTAVGKVFQQSLENYCVFYNLGV